MKPEDAIKSMDKFRQLLTNSLGWKKVGQLFFLVGKVRKHGDDKWIPICLRPDSLRPRSQNDSIGRSTAYRGLMESVEGACFLTEDGELSEFRYSAFQCDDTDTVFWLVQ